MQNRDALIVELEKTTSVMGRYDMENKLCAVGVPAAAVQSLQEFDSNPQTKSLNVITSIHQKGVGDYVVTNTPVLFSKTPVDPNASAAGTSGRTQRGKSCSSLAMGRTASTVCSQRAQYTRQVDGLIMV